RTFRRRTGLSRLSLYFAVDFQAKYLHEARHRNRRSPAGKCRPCQGPRCMKMAAPIWVSLAASVTCAVIGSGGGDPRHTTGAAADSASGTLYFVQPVSAAQVSLHCRINGRVIDLAATKTLVCPLTDTTAKLPP